MQNENADTGKTKDVGYQIGVRRTMSVGLEKAWQILTSTKGTDLWLAAESNINFKKGQKYCLNDGAFGEVRVIKSNSHLRITWQPKEWKRPSTIQIRVIPSGDKTIVAFHQENLPDATVRQERRKFFVNVLEKFEDILKASG